MILFYSYSNFLPNTSLVLEHKTNDWVRSKINLFVGPQEPLPAPARRRKLAWFGHVTLQDRLFKIILKGTLEVGRRRGLERKFWMDNIKEWTFLPIPTHKGLLQRKT